MKRQIAEVEKHGKEVEADLRALRMEVWKAQWMAVLSRAVSNFAAEVRNSALCPDEPFVLRRDEGRLSEVVLPLVSTPRMSTDRPQRSFTSADTGHS